MNKAPKTNLLVVDDEPEVCDSVYHLLRRKYNVFRAHGAAEAVEIMANNDIEIIMTDQRMPTVTGVEMLQKIKSQYPEAIRMLFTGYADIQSVIAAINQGHVYRYLSKPWQPEELEMAVADAAAEYERMVARAGVIRECEANIKALESEVHDTKNRVSLLEQENARLLELLKA